MALDTIQGNFPISIRFYLRRSKPVNVETSIKASVHFNDQRFFISIDTKVQPQFWNKGKISQSIKNPNHSEIQSNINKATSVITNIFNEYIEKHKNYPSDIKAFQDLLKRRLFNIPDEIEKKPINDLVDYTIHFIEKCESGTRTLKGKPLSENTIKTYRTSLRNITMFRDAGNNIDLDKLDLSFFLEYKEFLATKLSYNINTVGKHLRTLKAIVNECREDNLTDAIFIGKRYEINNEEVAKIYLDKDEIQRIFDLDLSTQPTTLGVARDLFILGANSALRFGDWLKLDPKKMKDSIIDVNTQKTGVKVSVPINQMIKEIFKKYENTETGLPPSMTNQEINRYIKLVAKKAEINEIVSVEKTIKGKKVIENKPKWEMVSSHSARRSAATNMYNMGIPTLTIMGITGHATEANFKKYIVLSGREHAKMVLELTKRNEMRVLIGGAV